MGFGGSLGGALGSVGSYTALGSRNPLSKILMGDKIEGTAGGFTGLNKSQKRAMGLFDQEIDNLSSTKNFDAGAMARAEIANQERNIRVGADDAERQAQALVAQRGMGRSTAGLNAILGVRRDLNDRIFAARAQEPALANQLQNQFTDNRINRLNSVSGGINNILGTRMYTAPTAGGGRAGGLLTPLLGIGGAALGGSMAGPQGAMAGYQVGSGLGNAATNYR